MGISINDGEFALFQRLTHRLAGISLSPSNKMLLVRRLSKRLAHYGFTTFTEYYRLLASSSHPEKRNAVENLLACLKPGGYFIVGHSESLHGITERLTALRPALYRKPT